MKIMISELMPWAITVTAVISRLNHKSEIERFWGSLLLINNASYYLRQQAPE